MAPIPFMASQGTTDQGISACDLDDDQFQNNTFEDDLFSQDILSQFSAVNANIDPFQEAPKEKLQFSSVSEQFSELCKMIQNDQQEMTQWMSIVTKSIDAYQNGKRVDLNVNTITCGIHLKQQPLHAITNSVSNATRVKRKISGQEYGRKALHTQRGGW